MTWWSWPTAWACVGIYVVLTGLGLVASALLARAATRLEARQAAEET